MNMLKMNTSKCKGCGLCVSLCTHEALTLTGSVNKMGYVTVVHNEESCIYCGMCYLTCPDCVFEILKEG